MAVMANRTSPPGGGTVGDLQMTEMTVSVKHRKQQLPRLLFFFTQHLHIYMDTEEVLHDQWKRIQTLKHNDTSGTAPNTECPATPLTHQQDLRTTSHGTISANQKKKWRSQ